MACTGIFSNPAAMGGDNLWNYFNLFYYSGYPVDGATSDVFGIAESGQYIPKISQFQPDGDFIENGICPSAVPLDSTDYNFKSPHSDVMLDSQAFSTPSGLFGILETNSKHSCLQDISECGGELWCNKIFFPRRSYKGSQTYVSPGYLIEPPYSESSINGDGTLVSPFGSTAICQANVERDWEKRYHGWGLDGQFKPYLDTSDYTEPDYIKYEIKNRFFDVCDEKVLTEVYPYNVGIDDSRISVRDYLPLIGVIHPGWRSTVATKSCVILATGCSNHYSLPVHTDQSIRVGSFAPKTFFNNGSDSMGYYLDKAGDGRFISTGDDFEYLPYRNTRNSLDVPPHFGVSGVYPASGQPLLPLQKAGASGVDQCLFSPFKILVDVECSTNRHKRLGIETDEPTSLSFISEMPGGSCGGLAQVPDCGCASTECNENMPPFRDEGESVYELKAKWEILDAERDASCNPLSGDEKVIIERIGVLQNAPLVLDRCVEVAATGGIWLDGSVDVRGIASSGCSAAPSEIKIGASIGSATFIYLPYAGNAPSCSIGKTFVYEVAETINTAMWDCTNHLYVSNAKSVADADPCDKENSLCESKFRLPLPIDCTQCYISSGSPLEIPSAGEAESKLVQGGFTGIYNEHPSTGWFVSDCGCNFLPQKDNQCTNSIAKIVITE